MTEYGTAVEAQMLVGVDYDPQRLRITITNVMLKTSITYIQ